MKPVVLNTATADALPKLEGIEYIDAFASPACFSHDGRLLVLYGQHFTSQRVAGGAFGKRPRPERGGFGKGEPLAWSYGPRFLCVWDTESGKLLKQWNQSPTGVAFHPTKPILAILEPNGENTTRLGLWDFTAEIAKK